MMKKTLFLILACMIITSVISAQVNVVTYGVSPRQAVADDADIFDLAFNGLENVGINTKVYFKGLSDVALASPTWTLLAKPSGSAAVLGTATDMDTSSQINTMTPDLKGTYKVVFTDGANADTITINAATYVGLANCNACHNNSAFGYVGDKWAGTGHSDIFKKAMEGTLSDHYGPNCISCHTTGNDPNADNDGFDDRDFVYPSGPDSLNSLTYALLTINSPEAMKLANIQCESCHGPGSEHNAVTSDKKMISSLDVKNCAICHDSGTHHAFPDQWAASGHDATDFDGRGFHGGHAIGTWTARGASASCAPCHSGSGYVQWVKEGKPVDAGGLPAAISEVPEPTVISCAVCHDPHDATQIHQLRLSDTQLGDGTPVTFEKYGTGAQCMECHRSRRVAAEYASDPANGSSHFGPHHGPQADMLIGKNTPDFGVELLSSAHNRIPNTCVSCHMAGEGVADADGNIIHVGGHSFNMNDANGVDNVEACEQCHAPFGESFTEKKYFMNNNADHDGDGVEEGLQEEVHGMLEELASFLPQDADGNVDMSSKTNPVKIVKAGYAYFWIEEDRSFGIHNPALTVSILKVAIESLKYDATMAGEIQSVTDIPMDQGFQVRLVWTKFVPDDGAALDKIDSYTILREVMAPAAPPANITNYSAISEITNAEVGNKIMLANSLWDVVAEVPAILYTEYAAVVPTLHNGVETNFKVLGKTKSGIVAETAPMSGISVDNLAPAAPANLAAAGLETGIELTWDESLDADFNYFAIYRSETQGFVPSETNLIANSVEVSYLDNTVGTAKYYYVVSAVDISGNNSEFSNEVSATLTDIQLEDAIPTEYALKQNYPNPFNPTTMIKFAIPQASHVKLAIYDVTGREVGLLVSEQMAAGTYSVDWNAVNLSTGIYFYRIEAGSFVNVKKMILIK